jgi:hypothetical protein
MPGQRDVLWRSVQLIRVPQEQAAVLDARSSQQPALGMPSEHRCRSSGWPHQGVPHKRAQCACSTAVTQHACSATVSQRACSTAVSGRWASIALVQDGPHAASRKHVTSSVDYNATHREELEHQQQRNMLAIALAPAAEVHAGDCAGTCSAVHSCCGGFVGWRAEGGQASTPFCRCSLCIAGLRLWSTCFHSDTPSACAAASAQPVSGCHAKAFAVPCAGT